MKTAPHLRIVLGAITGALILAVPVAGVWHYGYHRALDQLAVRAAADLALASDRLGGQLQRYREAAVLLAAHPALTGLDDPARAGAATAFLQGVADKTAALDVVFAAADGRVLAAARGPGVRDVSARPAFRRAMQGALGRDHGTVPNAPQRRVFSYGAPRFDALGQVSGVLLIFVDMEDFEQTWRGSTPAVFFTDDVGAVFISNRSELLGWRRPGDTAGLIPPEGSVRFSSAVVAGHEIWRMGWGPYLPRAALHLERGLPVIGMRAEVLVDIAPARRLAGLQAAAAAALALAIAAMSVLATVRRRTLAAANVALEGRVAARTRDLMRVNGDLRREIAIRQEAEAALGAAQADLVQAGKLSALGQMSAGISHELNQPLMAIQTFAGNARTYLGREQPGRAAENLGRIVDMADRMARIIRALRIFARQESVTPGVVDIVRVIEAACDLTTDRLEREGITLEWAGATEPVTVRGGEVRLGQVLVNLINNAADAMAGQSGGAIRLRLYTGAQTARVEVTDNGPGIAEPDRMFDPFYTTRAVGSEDGMGLGLSISYGLVQSFGGQITAVNRPGGGASLTVTLECVAADAPLASAGAVA